MFKSWSYNSPVHHQHFPAHRLWAEIRPKVQSEHFNGLPRLCGYFMQVCTECDASENFSSLWTNLIARLQQQPFLRAKIRSEKAPMLIPIKTLEPVEQPLKAVQEFIMYRFKCFDFQMT